MIGFYENNKEHLIGLLTTCARENISFFNVVEVEKAINDCVNARFLKRLHSECLFLNSIYLDYFNYCFDASWDIAESYNLSLQEYKRLVSLGKEINELTNLY